MKFIKPAAVLLIFLLSGCAANHVPYSRLPPRFTYPAKQLPPRARVPGTQRPYRVHGRTYYPIPSAYGYSETGIASWYGPRFHGRKTSNGETYNMYEETAAHKTLPMNTYLLVTNLDNGRHTVVRINDRGPFVRGRIIDLTKAGAMKLGMLHKGTAHVRITALGETAAIHSGRRDGRRFLPYKNFNRGNFFVQVGAFANRRNARRLRDSLLSQGYKTISLLDRHSGSLYRVQVRAGRRLKTAKAMERRLAGRFPGAFVIAH